MKKYSISLLFIAIAGILSSCNPTSGGSLGAYDAYNRPAIKPTNPNNVRVKVSTQNQMVYVLEGNKPLMVMPVSVGTASTPTPKGTFKIYSKQKYRRALTHGYFDHGNGSYGYGYRKNQPSGTRFIGTPMPYWMEFKSAYGFHTGWMKDKPCTHGCIRMHFNLAPKFFALVKEGTPLHIATTQPEDSTIGRNIPRPPDATPLPDFTASYMVTNQLYSRHKPVKFK